MPRICLQTFGSTSNPFTGTSIQTSFSASSTTTPNQSTTTSNPSTSSGQAILWGGAAAALLGATLAEWQKKRQEEEAARLAAMRNSGGEEDEEGSRKKTPGQIAYEKKQQQKQIVAESQALMDDKKAKQQADQQAKIAKLLQADMTEAERLAAYKQTPGYIARQESLKEYERQKALEAQRVGERDAVAIAEDYKAREQEKLNAVSAARWAGVASVAQGKQEEEKSGGKSLAMPALNTQDSWLSNIPVIGEALDKSYSEFRNIIRDESASRTEKTERLITWAIWNNPVFQAAIKNETVRNFYQGYTDVVGDSLRSIADPERNPRTAATRQMFIDGYKAWFAEEGIVDKYKNAWSATLQAVRDGRWEDAKSGTQIVTAESKALADGVNEAVKMSVTGVLATPFRIFTHDIPEFYNAGKERMEGKDRFWDVLFTSTNLMGDVAGTYGMVKPIGLVDNANSWLSKSLLGRELPVIPPKFVPYYLKDFFRGGANRNLINNLVENTYSSLSPAITNFLKFQNTYQRMIDMSQEIQASTPAIKPTQITADLDTIYKMASNVDPELRALIARIAEDTNGQTQFPNGLKGMERALQKINADYKGDASRITDITRGRIVYETLDDLYSGLNTLHEKGVIAYFKDRFLKPADSGYSDILTNVELSNTHIGELRLELRQINEVASVEHLIYEQVRSIKAEVLLKGRDLTPQETMIMDNLQTQAQKLYYDAWQKLIQNIKQ